MNIKNFTIFITIFFLSCKGDNAQSTKAKDNILSICISEGANGNSSYSKRRFFNKKALSILENRNDSLSREQLLLIGWSYFHMHNLKDFKVVGRQIVDKSLNRNDEHHLAKAYRFLGLYYEHMSINDSAFYFYEKANKLFKRQNNYSELCKNYSDKAYVQFYVNDFLGSDQSLIKALRLAKKHNFKINEYLIYCALGNNSFELGDYGKSIYYYRIAHAFLEKNNLLKQPNVTSCEGNIAINQFSLKKYREAITLFRKALSEPDLKLKSPTKYCFVLDNYARAKLKIKEFKNVEKYYLSASKIRDCLNIDQGKNFNKLYLSEYYAAVNDSLKARKFAHEAYTLSKSFCAPKDMLFCLKQLSKVEPQNALKYSQDYIRISDSMQQLERQSRNKFAKIAYETEEITNEKEAAIHQKWIFLGITVLAIVIGILLFITISQRAKQKELQFLQEQQKSDEEIYQLIQIQQAKIDEGRHIEKKRIARDLHDGIMNRLASTRLNLQLLSESSDSKTITKCLSFISGIQDIEKEIRNIAHDLNKDVFTNTDSFIAILKSLFAEQKSNFKTKCHFEIDKAINWDLIESIKKIHLYRILQEALNNINKHARAGHIIASIHNHENAISLEIYDDGIGFSFNEKKKGIGLQNIFSRTKAFKGTVEIKSNQGAGTTLIIKIPKKPQTQEPDNGNTSEYFNS